jgi:hypothetical protein
MAVANSLAYCLNGTITAVKCFIVRAPGSLFSSQKFASLLGWGKRAIRHSAFRGMGKKAIANLRNLLLLSII